MKVESYKITIISRRHHKVTEQRQDHMQNTETRQRVFYPPTSSSSEKISHVYQQMPGYSFVQRNLFLQLKNKNKASTSAQKTQMCV